MEGEKVMGMGVSLRKTRSLSGLRDACEAELPAMWRAHHQDGYAMRPPKAVDTIYILIGDDTIYSTTITALVNDLLSDLGPDSDQTWRDMCQEFATKLHQLARRLEKQVTE